ncbi:MAG: ABC transporter [Bacteroidetes bacterium]|nr:MAG: ABC transporter [Bacteroidota bacterium]
MSEEILKALIRLFAVISKQDGGVTEGERNYVLAFFKQQLGHDDIEQYITLYDTYTGYGSGTAASTTTTIEDSLQALKVSKKINKTLTQRQKIIALIECIGLINSDGYLSEHELTVLNTVATVFNVSEETLALIRQFVTSEPLSAYSHNNSLIAGHQIRERTDTLFLELAISGQLIFIYDQGTDLYFVKYEGEEELTLNSMSVVPSKSYLFSVGSTIKLPRGQTIYFSDIISRFSSSRDHDKLSFIATDLEFNFPNSENGVRKITIEEQEGQLIGIMGASGSGKTTLLKLLSGIIKPSAGNIKINGIDITEANEQLEGSIGYVPQDDILFEELTVYQNLYYNAQLSVSGKTDDEINGIIDKGLKNLGLEHTKNLKVGNVLSQTISGGQRKRLNIALELTRQPPVLFVDEPTSGLSSRDSENVIDLLKELTLLGKLIFVVIHQPSSDIYKMFDKVIVMDTGGYPIFYGNPIEAISYFKSISQQLDQSKVICETCGTVNPEQIFNIIEAKVVDEFGNFSDKRKVTPEKWGEYFKTKLRKPEIEEVTKPPSNSFKIPSLLKQLGIFLKRDVLSKVADKQYMLVSFLEAPVLAFILAFIIRYKNDVTGEYVFLNNDNIPAYLLMSIVVAIFLGLSVSAEEIIKDRKLRTREKFLHLSKGSYLTSKVIILFTLSAFQILVFVLIGNTILEIKQMTWSFWLALFSAATFANMLGLNISTAFKSAVTVYIIIPILLIPQMILSGLLFNFDKLNQNVVSKGDVPLIGDIMASRWALEALAVDMFKNNAYEYPIFGVESKKRNSNYKTAYWLPELKNKVSFVANNFLNEDGLVQSHVADALLTIKNEITKEPFKGNFKSVNIDSALTLDKVSPKVLLQLHSYLRAVDKHYAQIGSEAQKKQDKIVALLENSAKYDYDATVYKKKYFNENLETLVRNSNTKNRIIEIDNHFIRKIDLVFYEPTKPSNPINYRTHMYAPSKYLFGLKIDTFWFNIGVIWSMTIILYLTLYFDVFEKIVNIRARKY